MDLGTFISSILLVPVMAYVLIYEINWEYVWKVIKKWISL